MKIIVCFKILPNPDRILGQDWESFSLSADLSYAGVDFNCFDQSALEIGLKIKQQAAVQGVGATCTALTVCEDLPDSFTERLYSVGFDQVVCIPGKNREFCPEEVGKTLAEAARGADLVITGKEASMAETGMVPFYLADALDYPILTGVETALWEEDGLHLRCREAAGLMEKTVSLPLTISVGNSPEVLRFAALRARMQCRGRKPEQGSGAVLGRKEPPRLSRPHTGRSCTMLDPEKDLDFVVQMLMDAAGGKGERSGKEGQLPLELSAFLRENSLTVLLPDRGDAPKAALLEIAGKPGLLLLPDTEAGRELAVYCGRKENRSCFFGGTIQSAETDTVTVKKRVFGANLEWTETLPLPAVLTCSQQELERLSVGKNLRLSPEGRPEWLKQDVLLTPAEPGALQNASLVVACGSGIGSRESCDRGRTLAEGLGAGFGLTRPAALNAWGKTTEIIGQSGSQIAPACCLVMGAAGAGAFLVGIEKAKKIIAVNTDPNALIFQNADYGLLTDAVKLTEELLRRIQTGRDGT